VSTRFGQRLLARFPEHYGSPGRVRVEEESFHSAAVSLTLASAFGNFMGALYRDGAKYRGVYQLIYQPELERFPFRERSCR